MNPVLISTALGYFKSWFCIKRCVNQLKKSRKDSTNVLVALKPLFWVVGFTPSNYMYHNE